MEVVAIAPGFDGQKVREPGEHFEMPDGATGSWFDPVGAPPRAKGKKAAAPPAVVPPDPPQGNKGA